MTSRSAVIVVVLVVAFMAFCFASVFAAMTGTYHLNFGNDTTNGTPFFGNNTQSHSDTNHYSSDSVETYSDSGSSSSSNIETTEDTSQTPTQSDDHQGGGSSDNNNTP